MSETTPLYVPCASGVNAQTDCLVIKHGDLIRLVGHSIMDFDPASARALIRTIDQYLPPEEASPEDGLEDEVWMAASGDAVVDDVIGGDAVVDDVIERFVQRSKAGQLKYGHKLTRDDLSLLDWLRHAEEEQMDQLLYLRRAILDLERLQDDHK